MIRWSLTTYISSADPTGSNESLSRQASAENSNILNKVRDKRIRIRLPKKVVRKKITFPSIQKSLICIFPWHDWAMVLLLKWRSIINKSCLGFIMGVLWTISEPSYFFLIVSDSTLCNSPTQPILPPSLLLKGIHMSTSLEMLSFQGKKEGIV
jgi:hypothetical protein